MLKKFLAFLGLASVTLQDGKANIEMTEAQMEASGKIIQERDDAIAEVARLTEELVAVKAQLLEKDTALEAANNELTEANATVAKLTDDLKVLGSQAAEETAAVKTDTNAVKKDANPSVTSESKGFMDNVMAVKEAYL